LQRNPVHRGQEGKDHEGTERTARQNNNGQQSALHFRHIQMDEGVQG